MDEFLEEVKGVITSLLYNGSAPKIMLVKAVRDNTGWSLSEAKHHVDALCEAVDRFAIPVRSAIQRNECIKEFSDLTLCEMSEALRFFKHRTAAR